MLRLMHVHAHPDDESSKGAATTVKYVKEGVDVHVVTCTGGERGSILNPKMDRPDVLENISEIRRQEMDAAREILGVRQDWLGFVDSGWPEGDPKPPLPEGCFGLMDPEVAAEPLVRLIRSFRPHVLTTYDENGGYPHPDHIQCHNVSMVAFEAAGDPSRYPGRRRALAAAEALLPPRLQPPADRGAPRGDARGAAWSRRSPNGSRSGSPTPSTTPGSPPGSPCGEYFPIRDQALIAHATQIDPDGPSSRPRWRSSSGSGRPRSSSSRGPTSRPSCPRTTSSPGSAVGPTSTPETNGV